jgi:hypothetical protein
MGLGLLGGAPGQRKNFGADIAHAGLLGMQGYGQAKEGQARAKQRSLQEEMQQMQLGQMREQQAQRGQIRDLAGRAFGPNPNLVQNDDEGFPIPQAPGGGGMPEFAKGMMSIDPALGAQFMPKQQGPVALGEGGRLVDPTTGREIAANPKRVGPQVGQTREIKSGGKVLTYEWDGQKWAKIADAPQFKPDAPEKPEKAPPGYRYSADRSGLEPIPGGPADTKAGEKAEALAKREQGALARADFVLGNVREAIEETGPMTAGPMGAVARKIPGTGAYNLNKKLDAIRSNIGFAELQAMREASPTGGALGQVAVQELNMLQSVLGSLDTAQSPQQLEKTLYAIEKHYTGWKRAVQQSKTQGGPGKVVDWNELP